jgi:hypothetical protein
VANIASVVQTRVSDWSDALVASQTCWDLCRGELRHPAPYGRGEFVLNRAHHVPEMPVKGPSTFTLATFLRPCKNLSLLTSPILGASQEI